MEKRIQSVTLFSIVFCLMTAGNFAFRHGGQPAHATSKVPAITAIMAPESITNGSVFGDESIINTIEAVGKQVPAEWTIAGGTIPTPTLYLPLIARRNVTESAPLYTLSERMGYGLTSASLTVYTDVTSLAAGWYLDWRVREKPARPDGMEYVQMVRVHQALSCGEWYHSDRNVCPYAQPLDYRFRPSQGAIEAAAKANPGALWLIGNEMDRIDWAYCLEWNGSHCDVVGYNGQDEILPETYAVAYHDLYTIIKTADPTARIAIGGVIQPTPLRLEYLSTIWEQYQAIYSTTMPVDVWNVHNFIIREKAMAWGADIPPGIDGTEGEHVGSTLTHVDMTIFEAQIVAFREWMKERGQQHKPLIVSEYGVLFHNTLINPGWADHDPTHVQSFMTATFDYFATAKDCNLGYVADQCRLVQRWNWYSLDDTWGSFNPHSRLFDPQSRQMTATGSIFRDYVAAAE